MEQSRFDARERAREIAKEALDRGDASGWFESFYREARGDEGRVPWADRDGHPLLLEWLALERRAASGRSALVVGCGLGEDCEALASAGYDVTGFDISPTAIAWCRRRFERSRVRYEVADVFAAPAAWRRAFDLVFEAYTLQALPPTPRAAAAESIAAFVAPGGELLVVTRAREPHEDPGQLPWPLTLAELGIFTRCGLHELSLEDIHDAGEKPGRHFRGHYRRG